MLEYVAKGEWIEYTVNVSQAGTYKVDAAVASEISNGAFSVTFEKNNASTNFNTPTTGAWDVFQEITADNKIDLEAGQQRMRIDIIGNNPFNMDKLVFVLESTSNVNKIDNIKAGFTVSPNPSNGFLRIDLLDALKDSNIHLELFTVTGEKVGAFIMDGKATSIDLADYSNALYLLRLVGDNLNLEHRIVKY